MADITVDPSQVHSIEVDPSAVSLMPPSQDAGFWATIGKDVMNLPTATMDFLTGHPVEQTMETLRNLTAARQQHQQRAKEAYNQGDYKEAFHQLLFSTPIIGPPVGAAVDEINAGQPGQGFAHGIEALVPWLAPELNAEGFARIGGAIREAPGTIRGLPAAVAEKVVAGAERVAGAGGATADVITSPVARDVAGIVSPRAAHALNMAARARRVAKALGAGDAVADAAAADAVKKFAGSKYEVMPVRYGPPTPAAPPPGFEVAAASTAAPIPPAAGPPLGPVYQPPVTGALPGPVPQTLADMMRQGGFDIGTASTMEPAPAAARPQAGPVQPPVSGALPGTVMPAAEPAPATTSALQLQQAMEDLQRRRAAAQGIPANLTPAEAAAEFERQKALAEGKALEPQAGETTYQEQQARIEGGEPPDQTPPSGATVLGEGEKAVPADSVVMKAMNKAGIPEHYADMYAREGEANTARAFVKDQQVANYLLNKGITPDEFQTMTLEEQNKLIKEVPTASGKGKHKPYIVYQEGQPRAYGRGADEGIPHIADTMRWIMQQTDQTPNMTPQTMQRVFNARKALKTPPAAGAASRPVD